MFLLLLSVFSNPALGGNHINIEQYKEPYHKWQSPPTILVCNDNNFSIDNIKKAKSEWESVGKRFGKIVHEKDSYVKCSTEFIDGYLQIQGKRIELRSDEWAVTTRSFSDATRTIYAAIIESDPGTKNRYDTVLHEFGHVFGYKHNKIPGDILYTRY